MGQKFSKRHRPAMVNQNYSNRMGFRHLGHHLHVHDCICSLSSASMQLGAIAEQRSHFWLDWIPLCHQLLTASNLVNGLVIQYFICICGCFFYQRRDVVDWSCHPVILHVHSSQPYRNYFVKMGFQHLYGLGHCRFHFKYLLCSIRIRYAIQLNSLESSHSLCCLSSLCFVCFRGV